MGCRERRFMSVLCHVECIKKSICNKINESWCYRIYNIWVEQMKAQIITTDTLAANTKSQKFFLASVTEFTKSHTNFVFIWIKTPLLYLCCYIRTSVLELTNLYSTIYCALKCRSTQQTTVHHARSHATLFCHRKDLCQHFLVIPLLCLHFFPLH